MTPYDVRRACPICGLRCLTQNPVTGWRSAVRLDGLFLINAQMRTRGVHHVRFISDEKKFGLGSCDTDVQPSLPTYLAIHLTLTLMTCDASYAMLTARYAQ